MPWIIYIEKYNRFVLSVLVRVNFNQTLMSDPNARWAIYFKNANGEMFGTSNAIHVEDENFIPQFGYVNSSTSADAPNFIEFMFDYDNNAQGGRTPATDADIVIVAIGLHIARYVSVEGTIKNQAVNNFILDAALENYYV